MSRPKFCYDGYVASQLPTEDLPAEIFILTLFLIYFTP